MAEWRKVQTKFWDDPDTLDSTPEDKLFWLYLLSNPLTTACGVYTIHPKQASMHTGYNVETITMLLNRAVSSGRIEYDEETREVYIRKWFVYNNPNSPKVRTLIEKELKAVKTDKFRNAVQAVISYGIDTVSIQYRQDVDVDVDLEVDSKTIVRNDEADQVIDLLNHHCNARFKHAEASRKPIRARLDDGAAVDDCLAVIRHKAAQWANDAKMSEYLRPATLFGASKFDGYLSAARRWIDTGCPLLDESKNAASMVQSHDPSIYDRGRMGR